MRQKYVLVKNIDVQELRIQEFAELDTEVMSLMCEETYALETIQAAVAGGKKNLIQALLTNNLYPPSIYAEKIAESVIGLIGNEDQSSLELFFDDTELLTIERQSAEIIDDAQNE